MAKKKHVLTFQEFLETKKEDITNSRRMENWADRKQRWISAIAELYNKVDQIIIKNFTAAGYEVETEKREVRIIEDFIGAYSVVEYSLKIGAIKIVFNPIGTVLVGSRGRVDMVLPNGTVKLILDEDYQWKILNSLSITTELVDFNEQNMLKAFQINL